MGNTERLQSWRRISLNMVLQRPHQTQGEAKRGGRELGWVHIFMYMDLCMCVCVCVHHNMAQSCTDASRLCCPSVDKKKMLSALIKSLESVCVSLLVLGGLFSTQRALQLSGCQGDDQRVALQPTHTLTHPHPAASGLPSCKCTHTSNHTLHALMLRINQSGYWLF